MEKKWPLLAKILIGLGIFGGALGTFGGLSQHNGFMVIVGVVTFSVFVFFYQFKPWAFMGVSVILTTIIIFDILSVISREIPWSIGLASVIFRSTVLYYFNSKKIKDLFEIPENPTR